MVEVAVNAASDKKAQEVTVLDVGQLLGITDYFVICSGTSDRHTKTIGDEIARCMRDAGVTIVRREGNTEAGWTLLDYEDLVIHIFSAEARDYYDLERLWKDAPRVEVDGTTEAAV